MDSHKSRIKSFLARYFKGRDVIDDEDIFASGFVNSLLAVQLVAFIEGEFDVALENEDLVLENFQTVDAMVSLIERKRTQGPEEAARVTGQATGA
ncbi:acyl carrier protein [Chondromyces crocatus]|uniref:D-alanyl carrier protein n=1 Tax=Chondromyces crocatus TaxID=52 RepID=A0A0K1EK07_CHOCO|nr:acyl carrier protein [Chondromyces crocatus]AKT41195.1 D-alanyl carrier protein [Chondromyces crocatus]